MRILSFFIGCALLVGSETSVSAQKKLFNATKPIQAHVTAATRRISVSDSLDKRHLREFADGVCWVSDPKTRLWGLLDTLGEALIPFKYELPTPPNFHLGSCFLPFDADSAGLRTYLFPPTTVSPVPLKSTKKGSSKIQAVSKKKILPSNPRLSGYFSIDQQGRITGYFPQYTDIGPFSDGLAVAQWSVTVKKGKNSSTQMWSGYINTQGELVFPSLKQKFTIESPYAARPLKEGLRAHYDLQKRKWGFINTKGTWSIPAQFDEVKDFACSRAAVRVEDLWGYIDPAGRMQISPRFANEPYSFAEGYAVIFKAGVPFEERVCIIDSLGNIVLDKLEDALPFYQGVCFVNGKLGKFSSGRTYLLDKQFKVIKYIRRIEWGHGLNAENYPSYTQQLNGLLLNSAAYSMRGDKIYESAEKLRPFFCNRSLVFIQTGPEEHQRNWGFMNPQGEVVFLFFR